MWLELLFATLIPILIKGQVSSVSLTRITPNDILNGGVICPYTVEFTCIAVEVGLLQWQRNGENVGGAFNVFSREGEDQTVGRVTLFLDSISTRNIVANMTSRLVGSIPNLITGDSISCAGSGSINMNDTVTLNYLLREHPPEVPTNFSVSIETDSTAVDISITWDSAFNLVHNVSSYRIVAGGGSAASCPSSCDPSGPCKCTGLGIGENTTITISAINCGNQTGPTVQITARPQVPFRPSECNVLPVYSSAGDLSAVNTTWTMVNNLPEFLPGVSQDVTRYFVAVGMMDSMTIPASIVCPTSTCSYTYSLQSISLPNSPLSVSVSARNVIGRGQICTPTTEIDTSNQIFSLTLDTTEISNQSVACIQLTREAPGTFECEFCYSAGDSCQNLTCIPATGTPTLLPNLTELTYCYRATAIINGTAVAVIQDTFNTACPPDVLGTAIDKQTNGRCNSDSMGSVSIPNGLGCYNGQRQGALAYYQCDKWYGLSGGSSRTCMSNGNWDGEVPECRLNGGNIALLVLSILFWVLSMFLTVIACVALKKEISCLHRSLLIFHILLLRSKVIYVVLLAIEFPFLVVALLLWIISGVIPDNPNSGSQQTSLLIAAFILALPWIIVALIFLFVASKCSSDESAHQADVQKSEKGDVNTDKTPSMPEYAVPDKSRKKKPGGEGDKHRSPNQPTSKGVVVKKKAKEKKEALENIELPPYDVFEGPGHHTGKRTPKSPVIPENYDVLNVEGQQLGDQHNTLSQGTSNIPGEPQHEAEYSEVDKRSSQKRLLSSDN